LEYLLQSGFWETKAPYFIDFIIVYLISLPILMSLSIMFATKRMFTLHKLTQTVLFLLTLPALISFNYTIYIAESFKSRELFYLFIAESSLSIVLSILWLSVLLFALEDRRRRGLPGLYSTSHRKSGKRVFMVMLLVVTLIFFLYRGIYVN